VNDGNFSAASDPGGPSKTRGLSRVYHQRERISGGNDMTKAKNTIDPVVVNELEQSKNEVLQRIAEKLKDQMDSACVGAGHSSHASGAGRTHNSTTTH
jgi:hypothetical protein